MSLDFIDADHVLFTFNPKRLFTRLPDCPPTHNDRLVQAVVFDIPTGKVVKQEDWYLHDQRRYLWPLGSGRFLLRKLDRLFIVDSTLRQTLLLESPKPLLWVSVTPDSQQIVIERASDSKPPAEKSSSEVQQKNEPKFLVEFLDINTLQVQRTIQLLQPVYVDGTGTGFADSLQKGDLWLIRFGPSLDQRRNIARVHSHSVPAVFYSSNNSLLIGRNPLGARDYGVSAFTLSGRRLWQQHWSEPRYFPVVSRSAEGSRFGVSTVRHEIPPATGGDESNLLNDTDDDGLRQSVQVFETASGNPVLSLEVEPPLKSGRNVSLSPDGRRLAVLHGSAIEIFELPPISDPEQVQYSALKADAPGLYLPSADPTDIETDDAGEETPSVSDSGLVEFAADMRSSQPGAPDANSNDARPAGPAPQVSLPVVGRHEKDDPVATIKVTSKIVVVDVVVTDHKGRPVKGMRQEDFEVLEDGKPQPMRSFREITHDRGTAAADPPAVALPKPPANVFTNHTGETEPGSPTVILLDLLNTAPQDEQYARQELIKFLTTRANGSEFALCTLSSDHASHLRLIQGFTRDENLLLAAVNRNKGAGKASRWYAAQASGKAAVDTVGELTKEGRSSGFQGLFRELEDVQLHQTASDTDVRVDLTIDGLIQLARYLSGIPGKKNVVWLSGSFPITISVGADLGNPAGEDRNYAAKVIQATNLLARAHVAVYPVDVKGLNAGGPIAADNNGIGPGRDARLLAPGELSPNGDTSIDPMDAYQSSRMQQFAAQVAERDTITQIAADTGGKPFYSVNAIADAIATAAELGSNYYTLSYAPANKTADGKFRKIKVTLAQKGYHLLYRPGYFADDSRHPLNKGGELAAVGAVAMQHGSPQSREIVFAVQLVPVGGKKKADLSEGVLLASKKTPRLPAAVEVQHYVVDFAINPGDLRFASLADDTRHLRLHFMMSAFDGEGKQLRGVSFSWNSDLSPAQYADVVRGGVRVRQELDVPLQASSLRVGVADRLSTRLGTVELPLPVPPPPDLPRLVKHSLPEIEPD